MTEMETSSKRTRDDPPADINKQTREDSSAATNKQAREDQPIATNNATTTIPSRSNSKWTPVEDTAFLRALSAHRFGDWEQIARQIKTRDSEQVAMRANAILRRVSPPDELGIMLRTKRDEWEQATLETQKDEDHDKDHGLELEPDQRIESFANVTVTSSGRRVVRPQTTLPSTPSTPRRPGAARERPAGPTSGTSSSAASPNRRPKRPVSRRKPSHEPTEDVLIVDSEEEADGSPRNSVSSINIMSSSSESSSSDSGISSAIGEEKVEKDSPPSNNHSMRDSQQDIADDVPSAQLKDSALMSGTEKRPRIAQDGDDGERAMLMSMSLAAVGSMRRRKVRTDDGDWVDTQDVEGRTISHESAVGTPREKRKRRPVQESLLSEDGGLGRGEDPFRLVTLNDYGEPNDAGEAPFAVEISAAVLMLVDFHAHLHSSEIIGLLGGVYESGEAMLRITAVFPCRTSHSTGTQVDVDPLSEMEAAEFFERRGVRMAGWYHSHPNFEPNPSLRDLETQTMYQGLFRNAVAGSTVEPFVGLIVNPYMAKTESSSHMECFYMAPLLNPLAERLPYRLPCLTRPLSSDDVSVMLEMMRQLVQRADTASDRLDLHKPAGGGSSRLEQLFRSLQFHGGLDVVQHAPLLDSIRELLER